MTVPSETIERARRTPVEAVIEERGVELRGRIERCGPCPICGGVDRFAINTKKQLFNCRGCGVGGDVIGLVQHIDGCSFPEAADRLTGARWRPSMYGEPYIIHDADRAAREASQREDEAKRLKLALELFNQAEDAHGTKVEGYLVERKLELPDGADAIRFHPRCVFGGERVPCMLALFRHNLTDAPLGIQRTRLPPNSWVRGMKLERLNLGPTSVGSIKIDDDADVLYALTIGEGPETVLAGRLLGYRPAWATPEARAR